MKENEDGANKCSWIGRIHTVEMAVLLKAIYRCSAIFIKIPMAFDHKSRSNNPKICMKLYTF